MKLYNKLLCTAGTILFLTNTSLLATEKSAVSIMKNAYAYTGAMQQYAFDAIIMDEVPDTGNILKKYRHDLKVKVDRPGNLRVDINGDTRNRTNYIHNGTYTMVDHSFGYYGEIKVSDTIDDTLDHLFISFGITPPLSALIFSDMGNRMQFK